MARQTLEQQANDVCKAEFLRLEAMPGRIGEAIQDMNARALVDCGATLDARIKSLQKVLEAIKDNLKHNARTLSEAVDGKREILGNAYKATILDDCASRSIDSKALRAELPEIADKYTRETFSTILKWGVK